MFQWLFNFLIFVSISVDREFGQGIGPRFQLSEDSYHHWVGLYNLVISCSFC